MGKRGAGSIKYIVLVVIAAIAIGGGVIWASSLSNDSSEHPDEPESTDSIYLVQGALDPQEPIGEYEFPLDYPRIKNPEIVPVVPDTTDTNFDSIKWKFIEAANQSVTISYDAGTGPSCGEVAGVRVHEDDETVTIGLLGIQADPPPEMAVCYAVGNPRAGAVELKAPLGTRRLYHAQEHNGFGFVTDANDTFKIEQGFQDPKIEAVVVQEEGGDSDYIFEVLPNTSRTNWVSSPWAFSLANDVGVKIVSKVGPGFSCAFAQYVRTVETDEYVIIALISRPSIDTGSGGPGCIPFPNTTVATVALEKPLGTRRLYHAETDAGWTLAQTNSLLLSE